MPMLVLAVLNAPASLAAPTMAARSAPDAIVVGEPETTVVYERGVGPSVPENVVMELAHSVAVKSVRAASRTTSEPNPE